MYPNPSQILQTCLPTMPSKSEIEAKASNLMVSAGVEDQFPVPLENIATFLGYKTLGFQPPPEHQETAKVSGMIDYGGKTIYINTFESLPRQRFTLAHEIGHACLHSQDDGAIIDFRTEIDSPTEEKEREANQFAAELLMPRENFARQWLKFNGDVEKLSTIFGTSKPSVEFRIKNTVKSGV